MTTDETLITLSFPARVYRFPEAYANFCRSVELLETSLIGDWREEGYGIYQSIYRNRFGDPDHQRKLTVSYGIYQKDTVGEAGEDK